MTPMIDVVFLLIIFFLVSSHLAKQENSLQLDLPEAKSGLDEEVARESFVVNVLEGGGWLVGGVEVDEDLLASRMRLRQQNAVEPIRLKIRTDQNVPYRRLEPILRVASQQSIGDIVFVVHEERER